MSGGRDNLLPAFVIHSRPFRDTSLIVDIFTPTQGRMSVMARGAKSGKTHRSLLLQPFRALHMGWIGRGDLPLLTTVEEAQSPVKRLQGQALACGYYVNELIYYLLPKHEPAALLFAQYLPTLASLDSDVEREISLRRFELTLLHQIGYAPVLDHDIQTGVAIERDDLYHYNVPDGPQLVHTDATSTNGVYFRGASLLELAALEFSNHQTLRQARDLLRMLIHFHLGGRELQSRKMFQLYGVAGNRKL